MAVSVVQPVQEQPPPPPDDYGGGGRRGGGLLSRAASIAGRIAKGVRPTRVSVLHIHLICDHKAGREASSLWF